MTRTVRKVNTREACAPMDPRVNVSVQKRAPCPALYSKQATLPANVNPSFSAIRMLGMFSASHDQFTGDLLIKNRKKVKPIHTEDDELNAAPSDWFDFELAEAANSAIVLFDRATNWIDCSPTAMRSRCGAS